MSDCRCTTISISHTSHSKRKTPCECTVFANPCSDITEMVKKQCRSKFLTSNIHVIYTKLESYVGPSRARAPVTRVGCERNGILVSHSFKFVQSAYPACCRASCNTTNTLTGCESSFGWFKGWISWCIRVQQCTSTNQLVNVNQPA